MQIANLFRTLLPTYESVQLKNALKKSADGITTELLPRFLQLQELLATESGKPFHDKEVQAYSDDLVKYLSQSGLKHAHLKQPTLIEYIVPTLQNVGALAAFISKTIDKDMGRTVATSALTFNKATILQFVDIIEFTAQYSATLLNWITSRELAAVAESNIAPKAIAPGDVELIHTKTPVYGIALRVLGTPINKIQADYAEIPEAVFDENTFDELAASFGQKKVDPLGMASLPFPLSVVLRVQLWRAERQMDAYDECVKAGKAAEMRVLLLRKRINDGGGDAAAEKLLTMYESQYNELKYERSRLEAKYGLD